jgi:hypothetical protein
VNFCVHVSETGQAFEGVWVEAPDAEAAEVVARRVKTGRPIQEVRIEIWRGPWPPTAKAVVHRA